MKKKLLSTVLALIIVLGLLPTGALAASPASGTISGDVAWSFNDGILTITGTGEVKWWKNSHSIAPWNSFRSDIKSIIIADGITSIGINTFESCSNLTNVYIPNSVTSIDGMAFEYCSSLTTIKIPDSVEEFGTGVFHGCTGLTKDDFIIIDDILFEYTGDDSHVVIPNHITMIAPSAFAGNWVPGKSSNLVSVTIPASVKHIGYRAFEYCTKLQEISIPEGVTRIEKGTFFECKSLSKVSLPNSLTYIGTQAFYKCISLANLTIPSVVELGPLAFCDCSALENISLPDNLLTIGRSAFNDCIRLANAVIPHNVSSIETYAFANCEKLSSVIFSSSVATIGEGAFSDCPSLTSVTIPKSVTKIERHAFGGEYYGSGAILKYKNYDGFIIRGYSGSAAEKYATDEGHTFVALADNGLTMIDEIPATCEHVGNIAYWVAEDGTCYKDAAGTQSVSKADLIIPALGHDWGDWIVAREATETQSGIKTRFCKRDSLHTEQITFLLNDAPSSWAAQEVNAAIETGLVPENLQQDYQGEVSRAQVAQMFVNLLEQASGKTIDQIMADKGVAINEAAFTDTTDKAVLACNALGIINGTDTEKKTFSPGMTLSRAQAAAIINRAAKVLGKDTSGSYEFNDTKGHWVSSELGWPVAHGILKGEGNGNFNPGGDLTTEQAILIAYRALQALKQ